ncbi:MAG: hypothetical protein ACE5IK_07155 [Acidobacteriota bacterium]
MRRWPAVALLLAGAACATALRKPPPLGVLAGDDRPGSAAEVAALPARAAALFATRRVDEAYTAVGLWLTAAAVAHAEAVDSRLPVTALQSAAQAAVWLANHDADRARRRLIARRGVQAAQWCVRLATGEREAATCQYWLGAALGVQAREQPSTGLSALPHILEAFAGAARGSPRLDHGGPARALALLYLRAPGWPAGPGDATLGLARAEEAVALAPDHPSNWLVLGEARRATGDTAGSREAIARALSLARARADAGDPDAAEWVDAAIRASRD